MTLHMQPYNQNGQTVYQYNGLGQVDPFQVASGAAAVTSAAAAGGATSLLATLGVSVQVVPVVGQIAGAVLLVTGYIIAARAKAKNIKAQTANVEQQKAEARQLLAQLDAQVVQANNSKANIVADLQKLGANVSGLHGFGDWLKKTFAPGAYQEDLLKQATGDLAQLQQTIEQRIGYLEQIEKELTTLYDRLTNMKLKRGILWGVGIAGALTGLYFLNKEFKWIKL